jgi:hypothetical protein
MKKLAPLIAILLFSCNNAEMDEQTVAIYESANIMMPDIDSDNRQEKDVLVFKSEPAQDSRERLYATIIFRNVDGRLQDYRSFVKSEQDYDQAKYKWENDSTIAFRFVNTEGRTTETYTMSGHGGSTSLQIPN